LFYPIETYDKREYKQKARENRSWKTRMVLAGLEAVDTKVAPEKKIAEEKVALEK
jgi:hypothetical protein